MKEFSSIPDYFQLCTRQLKLEQLLGFIGCSRVPTLPGLDRNECGTLSHRSATLHEGNKYPVDEHVSGSLMRLFFARNERGRITAE